MSDWDTSDWADTCKKVLAKDLIGIKFTIKRYRFEKYVDKTGESERVTDQVRVMVKVTDPQKSDTFKVSQMLNFRTSAENILKKFKYTPKTEIDRMIDQEIETTIVLVNVEAENGETITKLNLA